MQATSGPITVTVDSAANFYATVVWGTDDRHVDVPSASGAGNIAGVLLPKAHTSSAAYAADDTADLALEPGRVIQFNKASGYTVTKGDFLAIINTDGELAPVSAFTLASGTNIEYIGKATEASASADTIGYMMITHGTYQAA